MTAPQPSSMIQPIQQSQSQQQPTFLHREGVRQEGESRPVSSPPVATGGRRMSMAAAPGGGGGASPSNYLPNLPSSITSQVTLEERKMWGEVQQLNAALLNQQALQAMVKEEEVLHELLEKTLFPKFFPAPPQSQQSFLNDMQFHYSSRAPTRNTTAPIHQEAMLLLLGDLTRDLNDAEVKLQSRIRALEEEKRLLAQFTIDQRDIEEDDGLLIASPSSLSPSAPSNTNKVVDSMTLPDEEIKAKLHKARKDVDYWDAEKKELLEKVAKLEAKCAKLGQLAEAAEEVKRIRLANKSKKAFQGFSTSNNKDLQQHHRQGSSTIEGLNDSSGARGGMIMSSQSALDIWNGTSSYHHQDPYTMSNNKNINNTGGGNSRDGSRDRSADRAESEGGFSSEQGSAGIVSMGGVGPNGLLNTKGMNHLEQEVKIIDAEIEKYEKLCHTTHTLLAVPKIAIPLHKRK